VLSEFFSGKLNHFRLYIVIYDGGSNMDIKTFKALRKKFKKKCPTEKACLDKAYDALAALNLHVCRKCDCRDVERSGDRSIMCKKCGWDGSFTAGTFFANAKKIWELSFLLFLTEQGFVMNANQVKKELRIAYDTALRMMHKIDLVAADGGAELFHEIPKAQFAEVTVKRSLETDKRKHPSCETMDDHSQESSGQANDRDHGSRKSRKNQKPNSPATSSPRPAPVNPTAMSAAQKQICEILALEAAPISEERLMDLTGFDVPSLSMCMLELEMEGILVTPFIGHCDLSAAAKRFFRRESDAELCSEALSALGEFKKWCKEIHQGVSGKYLQFYLASYALSRNASRRKNFFIEALQHNPVTLAEILAYVSPRTVRLAA
jgi:hypothetical protein